MADPQDKLEDIKNRRLGGTDDTEDYQPKYDPHMRRFIAGNEEANERQRQHNVNMRDLDNRIGDTEGFTYGHNSPSGGDLGDRWKYPVDLKNYGR